MSKETKRELIKRALLSATSGLTAEDVLEEGSSIGVATGLRAGYFAKEGPVFVKGGGFSKVFPA